MRNLLETPLPTVSVIISAFNSEEFIAQAIESALAQSLSPTEVIVVDDASTDNTVDVVRSLARENGSIKLIRQATNTGPGAARNAAIRVATSAWIAVLDADDRFAPDRLDYLVKAAVSANLDIVADNFYNYDFHAGQIVGVAIPQALIGDGLDLDRHGYVQRCMTSLAGRTDFGLLKPVFRRQFLLANNVWYRESARHGEDFLFCLEMLMAGAKCRVMPEAHY